MNNNRDIKMNDKYAGLSHKQLNIEAKSRKKHNQDIEINRDTDTKMDREVKLKKNLYCKKITKNTYDILRENIYLSPFEWNNLVKKTIYQQNTNIFFNKRLNSLLKYYGLDEYSYIFEYYNITMKNLMHLDEKSLRTTLFFKNIIIKNGDCEQIIKIVNDFKKRYKSLRIIRNIMEEEKNKSTTINYNELLNKCDCNSLYHLCENIVLGSYDLIDFGFSEEISLKMINYIRTLKDDFNFYSHHKYKSNNDSYFSFPVEKYV